VQHGCPALVGSKGAQRTEHVGGRRPAPAGPSGACSTSFRRTSSDGSPRAGYASTIARPSRSSASAGPPARSPASWLSRSP
jgi:hypothetical protein